ncbi:MAG: hypothetical protein ACKOOL_03475 [Novosphingobium sp.]
MSDPEMPEPAERSGWSGCWYAVLVLAGIGLLFFGTCLLMVTR